MQLLAPPTFSKACTCAPSYNHCTGWKKVELFIFQFFQKILSRWRSPTFSLPNKVENPHNGPSAKLYEGGGFMATMLNLVQPVNNYEMVTFPKLLSVIQVSTVQPPLVTACPRHLRPGWLYWLHWPSLFQNWELKNSVAE